MCKQFPTCGMQFYMKSRPFKRPKVYDRDTFIEAFVADVKQAKGRVLILSPYLGRTRIRLILPALTRCIKRGVPICVFVQEPDKTKLSADQYMMSKKRLLSLAEVLRQAGIHVTIRDFVHEKVVVVDDCILYDGSLNVLSVDRTSERMTRFEDRDHVA
ncbi:MAG: phospholipase D-like domain-containing protein, partial [Terriglobales bacterium]